MATAVSRIAELFGLRVDQLDFSRLTHRHVLSIRERLGDRYAPATVNQAISGLRGVLGVAHGAGLMGTEAYRAAVGVPLLPRSARRLGRTPSRAQVARLLKMTRGDRRPRGLRDRALLGLLAGGGLSRSEAASVRLGDLEPTLGRLRVAGRTIGIGRTDRARLSAWIAHRGHHRGPLFVPINKAGSLSRAPMSAEAVAQVVRERAAEAGLGALSPQDLRRAHGAEARRT